MCRGAGPVVPCPGVAGGLRPAQRGDPLTARSARKSALCDGGRTPGEALGEGLIRAVPLTTDPVYRDYRPCSGTTALEITARALGLSGEVIVPSLTFVATAHALRWVGLTPVFCDVTDKHVLPPAASGRTLAEVEYEHIVETLRATNGVIGGWNGAAARLGLSRTTLISRMQRLGISTPKSPRKSLAPSRRCAASTRSRRPEADAV